VDERTWPDVPISPSLSNKPSLNLAFPSNVDSPDPLTLNIGTPDISDAANTVPVKSSVTENN
jgi:hypothetical protein